MTVKTITHAVHAKVLALALILVAATLLLSFGQPDVTAAFSPVTGDRTNTDINGALLEVMASHRILLIADFEHGLWQSMQTVADFLDAWFRDVTENPTGNTGRRLALLLEADSVFVGNILRYISSGEPADILDVPHMTSGNFTLGDLQFYARIGDVMRRVQDWNDTHEDSLRIDLTLLPGEKHVDLTNWSSREWSDYNANERDSLICERIAHFIAQHPEHKIVGFYGAAHLKRGVVLKRTWLDAVRGRYLASYLDSLIPGGLITVGQVPPQRLPLEERDSAYVYTPHALFTTSSNAELLGRLTTGVDYDMVLVLRAFWFWPTTILQIPSENVARIAIGEMPGMMDMSNELRSIHWPALETYLFAITGRTPHTIDPESDSALDQEYEEWKAWSAETDRNFVPDILSLRVWQRLVDSLEVRFRGSAELYESEFYWLLPWAQLSVPRRSDILEQPWDRAYLLRMYLRTRREDIIIENLIGILWVGNKQERDSAQSALVRLTGQSFTTPTQWSEWRRR